jgi:hypothetical protein
MAGTDRHRTGRAHDKRTASWRAKFPINAAIRDIAHDKGLSWIEVAEILRSERDTVNSWQRTIPTRAPKMALALLCHELGLPLHPLAR